MRTLNSNLRSGLASIFWLCLIWGMMTARMSSAQSAKSSHRFPDFNATFAPPEAQYRGPLFRLSQDYPIELPEIEEEVKAILAIPYDDLTKENWLTYLLAVRSYCFAGNCDVKWRGQDNPIREWYHVPWQHFGEKGREGINGLTREATAQQKQLASTQKDKFDTHAVAMYNPQGGYTIGQVWLNEFGPEPSASRFPVGTIVAKILFTQADEKQVPFLKNPLSWSAYVQDFPEAPTRSVQDLQLLQMDIMVRDERAASTGGWVFGTFCYNGEFGAANKWENLIPVGLQWGNDPELDDPDENPENKEPTMTIVNPRLKQSVINPSKDLPPQHLGWGGRLNGPADYYRSSCMSCHSTAQYPAIEEQHPDFGKTAKYNSDDPQWSAWFRNLECGKAFSPITKYDKGRAISTDYSLQLAIGIVQFYDWKSASMGGYFTPVLPNAPKPDNRQKSSVPTSEPRTAQDP